MNPGVLRVTLCGLLPAAIVAVSMFAAHNVFVAMFLMHWIAMLPIILAVTYWTKGRDGLSWYREYLSQQEFMPTMWTCVGLFVSGAGIVVASYIVGSCRTAQWGLCVGKVNENIAEYGFRDAPLALVIICALYFPIINPIIEELYWRVFMDREYTLGEESIQGQQKPEEVATLVEASSLSPKLATVAQVPFFYRLLFSSLYASYHTMVVGVFLGGVLFGILAFFALTSLGLIFQFIFNSSSPRQGYIRAVFLHIGVDLGVVIALGDALGWYSLY